MRPEPDSSEDHRVIDRKSATDQINNSIGVARELIQMGLLDKAEQLCLSVLKTSGESAELRQLFGVIDSRLNEEREENSTVGPILCSWLIFRMVKKQHATRLTDLSLIGIGRDDCIHFSRQCNTPSLD